MTAIKILNKQLIHLIVFTGLVLSTNAQDAQNAKQDNVQPQRPKFSDNLRNINVSAVDNVVTLSFNLLKSVDDISIKVQAIEDQLHGSIPDASLLLTQINDCTSAVNAVSLTSPELAESTANMIGNIKDLHIPLLKIPSALKNLNEARKAIQYSISYTKYLIKSVLPNMKNLKTNTDSTSTQLTEIN